MARLTRIYTRGGDQGETSLVDGTRVPKCHPRLAACGTLDELNSVLGLLTACGGEAVDRNLLHRIQHQLFEVGGGLGSPPASGPARRRGPAPEEIQALEQAIDAINRELPPLSNFILPGGTPAAAWCHLARTVCRRAERELVALARQEPIEDLALAYVNRLSDLLFVLARHLNDGGRQDLLWKPREGADENQPAE